MARYSEGIACDGAVILCDGKPVPIEDVVAGLNERDELQEELSNLQDALKPFVDGAEHIMTFLTTRQRMHPVGVELWGSDVVRAARVLELDTNHNNPAERPDDL